MQQFVDMTAPLPPSESPLPVIPLGYSRERGPSLPLQRVGYGLMLGDWMLCFAATIAVLIEVESVVVSGFLVFVAGTASIVIGVRAQNHLLTVMGACQCAICCLFLVLVNGFGWGPGYAATPFAIMAILFTLGMVIPAVIAILRLWRMRRSLTEP